MCSAPVACSQGLQVDARLLGSIGIGRRGHRGWSIHGLRQADHADEAAVKSEGSSDGALAGMR